MRACGGGYGDPLLRDPADILDDVLDGYINAAKAKADYGVVIAGRRIDAQATNAARAAMRKQA